MALVGWRRAIVALAVLVAVAAGCGDDDDGDGASGTVDTTGQSSSSATTDASTSTTPEGELSDEPPLTGDAVSGSGCSPGGNELSDGWWYGTLDGAVASEVTFDLACYYTGDAAVEEAAARGDEVNNDFYVVNDNPQLRTVTVGADATASCVEVGSAAGTADCALGDVSGDWAVWLRVQDGEVDRVVEQYAP